MKEKIQKAYPYVMSIFVGTLLVWHFKNTPNPIIPSEIFGDRTNSVVDFWSMAHFINGAICGLLFGVFFFKSSTKNLLFLALAIAFVWEGAELTMELGYLGEETSAWKRGIEHWINRFFCDPMLYIWGAFIVRNVKNKLLLMIVASMISLAWLQANTEAKNSMHIQEKILQQFIP